MSHADRKLLAVALARAAGAGRDRQLAVGGLTAADEHPGSGNDLTLSLTETLAYAADLLQIEQDEIADETYLETSYDRQRDVVFIQFPADLPPVVCVVLDSDHAYVATVGEGSGDASVRFGDGTHGLQVPDGFERVGATYRHGDGGGTVELSGLGLDEPIWLIAFSRHHRGLLRRVRCAGARGDL